MGLSRKNFDALLVARDFDKLLGEVETAWFDAKDQPYDIDTDTGKRELARDVVAFANSGGGILVIGLRTAKSTAHFADEVVKIRPLERHRVDAGRYTNVVTDWVFPAVDGFEIEWLPTHSDTTRGLFAIRIPEQTEERRPFLVVRTLDGERVVETLFGYAERRGDVNRPMGIVDLQRTLRAGLNFERRLEERLGAIEAVLRNAPPTSTSRHDEAAARAALSERIDRAASEGDFAGDRTVVLVAQPTGANELKTIFSSTDDSIRRRLERPPMFRDHGWDLSMNGYAQIVRGEMIRVQGFRKLADLYRDGTFVFACAANEDFLAWTSKVQQLHPMAVVELCYNFAVLYELVLKDLKLPVAEIEFTVHLRNLHMNGVKTKIGAFGYGSTGQFIPDYIKHAPDDSTTRTVRVDATTYSAGEVAFVVAREIYLWFGLDEDKIPYSGTISGNRFVDKEALVKA
jgi:hypothetical protein